jgi:cytoskeletal protein CcmA (bactofilin family)
MFGGKTMKKPETVNNVHVPANIKGINGAPPSRSEEAAPAPKTATKGQNIIGKGTLIEGNVTADGDLRLEGTVRGDVTTKNTLVVAQGSVIEGNPSAQHAEIAGEVHGTVQATGLLTIKSTGTIDGDVITTNLNVEAGSTFAGRFQVGPTKKVEAASVLTMV